MAYRYQGTRTQAWRLERGLDHCPDTPAIYDLAALVNGGLIMDPGNPTSALSTPALAADAGGKWIYAVRQGALNVAPDGNRADPPPVAKHETLFNNADVDAAGELRVEAGVVTDINDLSGGYNTANEMGNIGPIGRSFRAALRGAIAAAGARCSAEAQEKING